MNYYKNEITDLKSGIAFKKVEQFILNGGEIIESINADNNHVFTCNGERLSGAAYIKTLERYAFVNVINTGYQIKSSHARNINMVGVWVLA